MSDDRKSLNNKSIKIEDKSNGNSYEISSLEEISRGGSCIVYKGIRDLSINGQTKPVTVILKEFYPAGLGIERVTDHDDHLNIPCDNQEIFKRKKERFINGLMDQAEYYEYYTNLALPRVFIFGEENDTVYAVSDPQKGEVLSNIDFEEFSLKDIASIMESICKAIKTIHTNERLYLDCKPCNFYYYLNKEELQAHVYMFDFDTVVRAEDVQNGNYTFCSASAGWVPEEQVLEENPFNGLTCYSDCENIGYHTDIYSIGAVFFWLLVHRAPTENDINAIESGAFVWEEQSRVCKGKSQSVLDRIRVITKDILIEDAITRKRKYPESISISKVLHQFQLLYGETETGNTPHFKPIHDELHDLKTGQEEIKAAIDKITNNNDLTESKIIDTDQSVQKPVVTIPEEYSFIRIDKEFVNQCKLDKSEYEHVKRDYYLCHSTKDTFEMLVNGLLFGGSEYAIICKTIIETAKSHFSTLLVDNYRYSTKTTMLCAVARMACENGYDVYYHENVSSKTEFAVFHFANEANRIFPEIKSPTFFFVDNASDYLEIIYDLFSKYKNNEFVHLIIADRVHEINLLISHIEEMGESVGEGEGIENSIGIVLEREKIEMQQVPLQGTDGGISARISRKLIWDYLMGQYDDSMDQELRIPKNKINYIPISGELVCTLYKEEENSKRSEIEKKQNMRLILIVMQVIIPILPFLYECFSGRLIVKNAVFCLVALLSSGIIIDVLEEALSLKRGMRWVLSFFIFGMAFVFILYNIVYIENNVDLYVMLFFPIVSYLVIRWIIETKINPFLLKHLRW